MYQFKCMKFNCRLGLKEQARAAHSCMCGYMYVRSEKGGGGVRQGGNIRQYIHCSRYLPWI